MAIGGPVRFSVGLLDKLFGEKVVVTLPQQDGTSRQRTVTRKWLERVEAEGKIQRQDAAGVPVRMLGLTGYETEHWTIGEELTQEEYDHFFDQGAGAVHAMRMMREGSPVTYLLAKQQWLEMKKELDRIG